MKCDVIMSHIFNSYYTHRALEAIGSKRRILLVDNSFCGEMRTYCTRNPHVVWLRPKIDRCIELDGPIEEEFTPMVWNPLTCSASWNLAMENAETDWVINVNPDTAVLPQSLQMMEMAIQERHSEDVVLMRTQVNFNFWAADRGWVLEDGGFDTRFKPCAGEDEDILVRVAKAGKKWQRVNVPAVHQDGGHKDRVDVGARPGETYCNASVFVKKWGWMPHSPEFKKLISASHAGGPA